MKKPILIVIVGPTASGKTEITIEIAKRWNIPIINADSRQIFKELPIGTAAPSPEQLSTTPHLFVGTHTINEYFSASLFEEKVISHIANTPSDLHLLSGGSMMYIDAVCNGIDEMPTISDEVRSWLMHRFEAEGLEVLSNELKSLDPEHWKIVDRKNHRRVIHALEICYQTGKTYTSFRTNKRKERPFKVIKIGLERPRNELYDRINNRVIQMIEDGLVDEAKSVEQFRSLNALNTVGYKEIFEYIDGLTTLQEAIYKIQSNTRKYARKQLTWLKRDATIKWFNPENTKEILNYLENSILQEI